MRSHWEDMSLYRFVTPHRTGKWYSDLVTAQRQAFAIGAGFRDERTGTFYAYKDTRLEVSEPDLADGPQEIAA
ncbi:hypothetical protein Saro_2246 [Novosphingobium aromaticivorans DSM 12444]|uniref:Uncharacterized protein n=2 Tax=Novosphingobium aromaticivorans TaxID=48935 RepID=Q2G640_NOVAD|nr:hypothetical protein [Novosphingobium aromaticivorans]ABD26683.1 hypothetical protein Saro_2246 [Novosphingobium aromaticivorans DSM 12444]